MPHINMGEKLDSSLGMHMIFYNDSLIVLFPILTSIFLICSIISFEFVFLLNFVYLFLKQIFTYVNMFLEMLQNPPFVHFNKTCISFHVYFCISQQDCVNDGLPECTAVVNLAGTLLMDPWKR